MSVRTDVSVSSPLWSQAPDAEEIIRRTIAACAQAFEPEDGEVSVLLCDDAEIRRLNAQWRGKDYATNVLSFPSAMRETPEHHLGDIAVAYETVAREATSEGKAFQDHLAHLAAHGYLHLIGFDHETDEDAEEMEALEREILAGLGINDPYAEPAAPRRAAR